MACGQMACGQMGCGQMAMGCGQMAYNQAMFQYTFAESCEGSSNGFVTCYNRYSLESPTT